MAKTGLVVEGGGMRCAYSAGLLDRFMENGITFDYCIGVSAGSANTASYVAGQKGRNIRFYTEHVGDPRYFGLRSFFKTGDIFGLEYIYGDLTNSDGKDPIDYQAILDSPMEFKIVATNALTGKPEYFDKSQMIKDDYRHIMASCAIPAACRPVEVEGNKYYDGGVADSIPVQRALDDGCERLVVILSKPKDFVRKRQSLRAVYSLMCRKYPQIVKEINTRHIEYKKQKEFVAELENEGRAFVFAPDDSVNVSTFNMDVKKEQQLYDMGLSHFDSRFEGFAQFMAKED